jgi:TonB family protein
VVSTSVRGITRNKIWDPAHPITVDIHSRWILERSGETFRVRQKGGTVSHEVGSGGVNLPNELKLRIVPASTITPPYRHPEGEHPASDSKTQLMAFSGVGRGITGCQPVHGAYVAYTRKQPVFTLYFKEGGFRIKPLLDGVRFKLEKQSPISGPVGEEWKVTAAQLSGATVIRGSHWWRFNLVPTAFMLEEGPDSEALLEGESRVVNKVLGAFFLLFIAFSAAVYWVPRPEKIVEEPKEVPIVKFIAPPPPKPQPVPTPPPVVVEAAQTAAPAPAPKTVPVKAEAPKPKAPNPEVAKTPPPDAKAAAKAAATAKLQMLRAALGGAMSLTQTPTAKQAPSANNSALFAGTRDSVAPTDIKPTYAGDNSKVGAVGGAYSDDNAAAAVDGTSSSFVSTDTDGSTVEQGLSKDEVGAVIHRHADEIRYCHENAMLYHPNLEGKLVVQFSISAAGVVQQAAVQSSTLGEKSLEECLMKRLAGWRFPKPRGGVAVSVSYPFIFKSLEGG